MKQNQKRERNGIRNKRKEKRNKGTKQRRNERLMVGNMIEKRKELTQK